MPRHRQDGRAARAGAADSLLDITRIFKLMGATEAEAKAERHTRSLDLAHFAENPQDKSYIRPYHSGELPFLLLLPSGEEPCSVAVALASINGQPERARVFLWPHHDRQQARRIVERKAARLGGAL